MSSTYASLLVHIIFSTKDREPLIVPSLLPRLHEYLGGSVRGLDGISLGVGGIADHVHLLVSLNPTHRLPDFMRELKKQSSIWIAADGGDRNFRWQEGYAAFSVNPSARASVQAYIAGQAEHHRVKSFREELMEFLRKSEVEFDERYLD